MVTATADPTWIWSDCEHCDTPFGQPNDPGRKRRFCTGACRTAAYRARKRRQEQQQRRQQDQYTHHEYEDQKRHDRARARSHQPPPHAGTSRPHTFCGACGGLRAEHTYHHDNAAHQRARRRHDGLKAKAAATSYPHEADACHAKAEQLRDKYGL